MLSRSQDARLSAAALTGGMSGGGAPCAVRMDCGGATQAGRPTHSTVECFPVYLGERAVHQALQQRCTCPEPWWRGPPLPRLCDWLSRASRRLLQLRQVSLAAPLSRCKHPSPAEPCSGRRHAGVPAPKRQRTARLDPVGAAAGQVRISGWRRPLPVCSPALPPLQRAATAAANDPLWFP